MENLKCLKDYFREEQSQLLSSISCNVMLTRLLHVVIHTGILSTSTQSTHLHLHNTGRWFGFTT